MSDVENLREQIKRKLHSYIDLKYERQQLEHQLNQLRATAEAPRSQAMDGMPHGSGGGDAMASIVAELVELQKKYEIKLLKLIEMQATIEVMIEKLESTERQLMRFRYIEGLPWETVCVAMNYSWRQTHRIHGQALDKLVAAEIEKQEVSEIV